MLLGVLLALQSSAWVEQRKGRAYHAQTMATLATVLDTFAVHGGEIAEHIEHQAATFDAARSRGERPPPPFYAETQRGDFTSEKPPTALWSAIVATGVAQSLDPDLLLRLTLFFDRADTFGERYRRYNAVTEARLLPYRSDPERFYGADGELVPVFADHLEQMRSFASTSREMSQQARTLEKELRGSR